MVNTERELERVLQIHSHWFNPGLWHFVEEGGVYAMLAATLEIYKWPT